MRLGADILVFDTELSRRRFVSLSDATESKGDRPSAAYPRYFCPTGTDAGRQAASRACTAQISACRDSSSARIPRFHGLRAASADAGPAKRNSRPTAAVFATVSQISKSRSTDLGHQRQERRKKRVQKHLPIISLVGYTNAGKSTLLNS